MLEIDKYVMNSRYKWNALKMVVSKRVLRRELQINILLSFWDVDLSFTKSLY